jgi:hypothetical protein
MFVEYLKKLNIDPNEYLKIAKKNAKNNNLDPKKLTFAINHKKKLSYDGTEFGAYGYNDYIIYKLLKDPKAEIYKNRYQKSHSSIKGNWEGLSPNRLSLLINW